MSIRRWFDRVRKVLVWGLGVGLFVLGTLAALVLFTPAADTFGRAWLTRALAQQGITLSAGETRGSLARGLEVRELSMERPGRWSLTASRVRLELSIGSVLWGRPQLKELQVDGAQVVYRLSPSPEREAGSARALPRLGISRWVVRSSSLRVVREGEPVPWVGAWSSVDGEGSFSMGGQGLRLSARSLDALPGDGRLHPLRASGSLSWAGGTGLAVDLSLVSAGSDLSVRGRLSGAGEQALWKGTVESRDFGLDLLKPFWPGAPERRAGGTLAVEISGGEARWQGKVEVPGSGRAEGTGSFAWTGPTRVVRGEARVEGFALGSPPLLPALQVLAPWGSGRVEYEVLLPRGGPLSLRLGLDLGAAELYGMSLSAGKGTVSWSAGALGVEAQGASELAESVQAEVTRSPEGLWQVRAQGTGVLLEALLQRLRLWQEPPAPLRLPESPWRTLQLSLEIGGPGGLSLEAAGGCEAAEAVHLALRAPPGGGPAAWEVRASSLQTRPCGLPADGLVDGTLAYRPSGEGRGLYRAALQRGRLSGIEFEPFEATVLREASGFRLEPVSLATSVGRGTLALSLGTDGRHEGTLSLDLPDAAAAAAVLGGQAPGGPLLGTVEFGGGGSVGASRDIWPWPRRGGAPSPRGARPSRAGGSSPGAGATRPCGGRTSRPGASPWDRAPSRCGGPPGGSARSWRRPWARGGSSRRWPRGASAPGPRTSPSRGGGSSSRAERCLRRGAPGWPSVPRAWRWRGSPCGAAPGLRSWT